MKAQNIQNFLQLHQSQKSRAERCGVELRKSGLLSSGGRGPHAPEISLKQAIQFICAHAGAETYRDAAKAAVEFPEFVNKDGSSLLDYLTEILTDFEILKNLDHIQFIDWKVVRLFWKHHFLDTEYFLPVFWWDCNSTSPNPLPLEKQGSSVAGRIGYIGGDVLLGIMGNWEDEPNGQYVTELKNYRVWDSPRSGWVGDKS